MPEMKLEELIENFALFEGWEERYAYLIDLGRGVAGLESAEKTEENRVRGCVSQVWMVAWVDGGRRFRFRASSDSLIVQGLIGVLRIAYDGLRPEEIRDVNIEGTFESLGLSNHLSPNRRNGFFAMVERIRASAAQVRR